jgi:two-component system sensor histidine kinase PilS (NtrC family)
MPLNRAVLRVRLQWLMFLRVVVATFLLGVAVLLQIRETGHLLTPALTGIYGIIATTYFLTLLYIILLRKINNLRLLAYGQIVVDLLLETVLVYLTGLEDSVFFSIYYLSIITGSILLYRRGGLITASLSAILYGGLLDLRYYGLLPIVPWQLPEISGNLGSEIFFTVVVNTSAFFLVAMLSSYLAEQARISQKELAETQSDLSELTAIHEDILQCIYSGVLTADRQGRITFMNRAAQEITGLELETILGKPLPQLFPQLSMDLLQDLPFDPPSLQDRRRTMDFKRPDEQEINLGFSLAPLRNAAGTRMGTIVLFQDLTQTIAMEEHLRRIDRLATIGELAARIAHEIRNPLASLSGSIQLLKDELRLDGPNERLMEIVMRETHRLNALLTDFLLFAHPAKLQLRQIDLSASLEEILELFVEREGGANFVMMRHIEGGLQAQVDPKKIQQIMWNLLNNALEAMPNGGRLEVRANRDVMPPGLFPAGNNGWIRMEVEDSGVGISEEVMERIYDPFFTTKDRGTGLGLSMVHRSVEDLGGRVDVQSRVGKGTLFTIWIPQQPPSADH